MIILTRKEGESLTVPEPSTVTVIKLLGRGKVRLGIEPMYPQKGLTEPAQKPHNTRETTTQRQ